MVDRLNVEGSENGLGSSFCVFLFVCLVLFILKGAAKTVGLCKLMPRVVKLVSSFLLFFRRGCPRHRGKDQVVGSLS